MQNVIGLAVSALYVLGILAVSSVLSHKGASSEATRKLVHIALGGWWFIAMAFFNSPIWAAVLPALFIAVNSIAYWTGALPFMAREEGDTPGTVYYAISLTLLALLTFWINMPYAGALGVLCMSLGDGFAAIVGKRFGKRSLPFGAGRKTIAGTLTMFALSLASCLAVLLFFDPARAVALALVLAAAAAVLELVSPDGLDNLAVPLGVSALYLILAYPGEPYSFALLGLLLSGAAAIASLRLGLLTVPATLGAVIVGTLAFAIGGWPLWLLLMWFFGSSNIVSRIIGKATGRQSRKPHERRKLRQVLANSVPFLTCAIAFAVIGAPWLLTVSAGALAACTADTWASEIGTYSTKPPVNILTLKPMRPGLSGGVSVLGLAATAAGAVITAFLAMLLFHAFGSVVFTGPEAFLLVIGLGVAGSLIDSVLGAAVQAKYRCTTNAPNEEPLLEDFPRGDKAACTLVSGYAWITNDAVNLMSGIAAVALGLLLVV